MMHVLRAPADTERDVFSQALPQVPAGQSQATAPDPRVKDVPPLLQATQLTGSDSVVVCPGGHGVQRVSLVAVPAASNLLPSLHSDQGLQLEPSLTRNVPVGQGEPGCPASPASPAPASP